jgi:hypothetical protein
MLINYHIQQEIIMGKRFENIFAVEAERNESRQARADNNVMFPVMIGGLVLLLAVVVYLVMIGAI